jgi:hypothetical protein
MGNNNKEAADGSFNAVDYSVFVSSLLIALGIGVWSAWKRRAVVRAARGDSADGPAEEQKPASTGLTPTAADDLVRSRGKFCEQQQYTLSFAFWESFTFNFYFVSFSPIAL